MRLGKRSTRILDPSGFRGHFWLQIKKDFIEKAESVVAGIPVDVRDANRTVVAHNVSFDLLQQRSLANLRLPANVTLWPCRRKSGAQTLFAAKKPTAVANCLG